MRENFAGPSTIDQLHERASRPSEKVVEFLRDLRGDVMVIGAGGKMGFHLTNMLRRGLELAGQTSRLMAVSRFGSASATELFERNNIETLSCDLIDPRQLSSLPDAENIFALAGVKFGTANDPSLLQQMNVDMPAGIAQRFSDARIVALSTGCVYPFVSPQSGGSKETDPVAPVGEYALSCLGRERSYTNSSAKCVLIRLNYSVDLRYGVVVDIAQKVLHGQPIDVTMGYANVIWQGDACEEIIMSLGLASRPPCILNVTGSQILQIRKVATRFAEIFDKPVTITGSESNTAWLNNASQAHRLFGSPAVDEDTLIQWVAHWLLSGGEILGKPTHFEVRDGKY